MTAACNVQTDKSITVSCPVCNEDNRAEIPLSYSRDSWNLKTCRNCGMVYLENPPAPQLLEEDFAWEKTFVAESVERRQRNPFLYALGRAPKALLQRITRRNKLLSLIEQYIPHGPILDIGCAGGHTLAALPHRYVPHGIEISRELSAVASSVFSPRGGSVLQADALTGLSRLQKGYFSGIVMTAFLEHDIDARATLGAARNVMADGAALIVKVPNYDSINRVLRNGKWCGFRFPDHVNYFTPKSLKAILVTSGFKVVRFGILDRLQTSDNMWLVAEKPLNR